MLILTAVTRMLDVVFPPHIDTRRIDPTDTLVANKTLPQPAGYDSILASLSGSALFSYRDPHIRAAIKSLKYDGRKDVVEWFVHKAALRLRDDIHEHFLIEQKPLIVVPIPLTRLRYIERGFNQSALIAHALCKKFPNELEYNETCLTRSTFSQSQTKVRSRTERAKNIRDAFVVQDNTNLTGRTMLIVDDIITTGATIHEAARILRAAGAHSVRSFALAH